MTELLEMLQWYQEIWFFMSLTGKLVLWLDGCILCDDTLFTCVRHSVIHGRQFPLKGRFMANVFIHFEPVGPMGGPIEFNGEIPPYILRGSEEEAIWKRKNPQGHVVVGQEQFTTGSTDAHRYAAENDYEQLARYLDRHAESVTHRDVNGWTPLAEAVRTGDVRVIQLLLDRGSEVNARIGTDGNGASVLNIAKEELGDDHEVVKLLISRGARDLQEGQQTEL